MKTIKAVVSGRVQGVGFRYFAKTQADSLAINGYAKNLFNGRVEVIAQGSDEAVRQFIVKLEQGPRFATVTSVDCTQVETSETYSGFGTG